VAFNSRPSNGGCPSGTACPNPFRTDLWQRRFWEHAIRDEEDYASYKLRALQPGQTWLCIDGCALAAFDVSSVGEGRVLIHAIGVARVRWMMLPASVDDNVVTFAEHPCGASTLGGLVSRPADLHPYALRPLERPWRLGRARRAFLLQSPKGLRKTPLAPHRSVHPGPLRPTPSSGGAGIHHPRRGAPARLCLKRAVPTR
jgi:hypothetical protein